MIHKTTHPGSSKDVEVTWKSEGEKNGALQGYGRVGKESRDRHAKTRKKETA